MSKADYVIFQIQHVPEEDARFWHIHTRIFESLKKGVKVVDLKEDNYKAIYAGEAEKKEEDGELLEELFTIFNVNHPSDFRGRSMSVSDIVQIDGKFYHCNSCGWQEIKVKNLACL